MKSFCLICGNPIEYAGEFWDHIGPLKPRHISQPRKVDELIIRLEAHEKTLSGYEELKNVLEDIREYKEYLQNEFGIEKEEK